MKSKKRLNGTLLDGSKLPKDLNTFMDIFSHSCRDLKDTHQYSKVITRGETIERKL